MAATRLPIVVMALVECGEAISGGSMFFSFLYFHYFGSRECNDLKRAEPRFWEH